MDSDSPTDLIVGGALAATIMSTFDVADGKEDDEKEIIRVAGFSSAVVAAAVNTLRTVHSVDGNDGQKGPIIRIAGAHHAPGTLASSLDGGLLLDENASLTAFRNSDDRFRYILFVMSEQSDKQSFGQVFSLRDRDLLDDEDGVHRLLETAWRIEGQNGDLPQSLTQKCAQVINRVRKELYPTPVRKIAEFARTVVRSPRFSDGVSVNRIMEALLESLPVLDLFPDVEAASLDLTDAAIFARLKKNYFTADFSKPTGSEIDAEKLAARARITDFEDVLTQKAFGPDENSAWQDRCAEYCLTRSSDLRSQIPWGIFSQILKTTVSQKLGERVRSEIEACGEPRFLEEFDRLDIADALSRNDPDAARLLMAAPAENAEDPRPIELLSKGTRRAVERLAHKAHSVSSFLPWLIEQVYEIDRSDNDKRLAVELAIEDSDSTPGLERTTGLFAFMFGDVLKKAEIASEGSDRQFVVSDSRLLESKPVTLETLRESDTSSDEEQGAPVWPELLLRFRCSELNEDEPGQVLSESTIKWEPAGSEYLQLFFLLCCEPSLHEVPRFRVGDLFSHSDWVTRLVEGVSSPEEYEYQEAADADVHDESGPDLLRSWMQLRKGFLEDVSSDGLSADHCRQYFERWNSEVLVPARSEFILTGSPRADFSRFMETDLVDCGGSAIMLPSHPLRVRWIGEYLAEMQKLLVDALNESLNLVEDNDGFLFDALRNLSPHQQPPSLVLSGPRVMKSAEEKGWAELYKTISQDDTAQSDWLSSIDDDAVEILANECVRYVEFHPYKSSGIDILVIQHGTDSLVERLVSRILSNRRAGSDLSLRVHVVVPHGAHFANEFISGELADSLGSHSEEQLFPRVQVHVYSWDTGAGKLPEMIAEQSIDLAVVPNILIEKLRIKEMSGASDPDIEAYHALYTRPVRPVALPAGGANMQVDLLPNNDDPALSDWASLSVMLKRSQPMSQHDSESAAHLRLVVDIASSDSLFNDLHELALWVLTLDSYVSRRHIEQLPSRPEVITYREGVGKNRAYNLVVSSNMGREFVVPRLRRKIESQFEGMLDADEISRIAGELYEEGATLAPGIVLRSLGGGWTLNELLGLVATRRYLDREESPSRSLNVWIALDEHADWFGGPNVGKRADLMHVEIFEDDDSVDLRLTVVESKFGTSQLAQQGVQQVKQSEGILREAFAEHDEKKADRRLWRESLLSAIENSMEVTQNQGDNRRLTSLDERVRNIISSGDYRLLPCSPAVVCHVITSHEDSETENDSVRIAFTGRDTILALLRGQPLAPESQVPEERDDADEPIPPASEGESIEHALPNDSEGDEATVKDSGTSVAHSITPAEVETIYAKLMDRFANLKVDVIPLGSSEERIVEGPSVYRIRIKPGHSTPVKRIRSVEEEIHGCLELNEEDHVRIFQDKGVVWIEAPKPPGKRSKVLCSALWQQFEKQEHEGFVLPLGMDMRSQLVAIDFSSANSPHLLIAGTTGSGKSVALNTLLLSAIKYYQPDQLRLFLIDPKGVELVDFEDEPHVQGDVEDSPEASIELLEACVQEMQSRYKRFRALKKESGKAAKDITEYNSRSVKPLPRWLVVLDEYADLVANPDDKKEIERLLQRLCQKARAAGIHVIVATQKPLVEVIGSVVKSNLPAALALKVGKGSDSKVILDDIGAEALVGKGDALLKTGSGRIVRLQCAIHENE